MSESAGWLELFARVHPTRVKPVLAAIGDGEGRDRIKSQLGGCGAVLDVTLGHKDDPWAFPQVDTIAVSIADAPRRAAILVVIAVADGGRLRNRCGTKPIR